MLLGTLAHADVLAQSDVLFVLWHAACVCKCKYLCVISDIAASPHLRGSFDKLTLLFTVIAAYLSQIDVASSDLLGLDHNVGGNSSGAMARLLVGFAPGCIHATEQQCPICAGNPIPVPICAWAPHELGDAYSSLCEHGGPPLYCVEDEMPVLSLFLNEIFRRPSFYKDPIEMSNLLRQKRFSGLLKKCVVRVLIAEALDCFALQEDIAFHWLQAAILISAATVNNREPMDVHNALQDDVVDALDYAEANFAACLWHCVPCGCLKRRQMGDARSKTACPSNGANGFKAMQSLGIFRR